LKHAAQQATV